MRMRVALVPRSRLASRSRFAILRGLRGWGLLGLVVALALACGGTVVEPAGQSTGGEGGSGAEGATGGTEPVDWPTWDAGQDAWLDAGADASEDVRSDYVDPICPDAATPPPLQQCDLTDPHADCPLGYACYPFVEYPDPNDDCSQEQYGTVCALEGSGVQGDPCGRTGNSCSAGYICVVTGAGTQCLQLCEVLGVSTCPPGLLCLQVDVQPGVGGCY